MCGSETPGPIRFAPSPTLFEWVDKNEDDHGCWLAGLLPKTMNQTPAGRITRDFVARYGTNDRIMASFSCRFGARSYCGLESDHDRRLRDGARSWLSGENDPTVIRWIEKYIESLGYDIQRAEIDEERRF